MTANEPRASIKIRHFQPGDLSHLVRFNNEAAPAVNELAAEGLLDLIASSFICLVAVSDDQPAGFLLAMKEGADYASENYVWLSKTLDCFVYTDRICVGKANQGQNIGQRLYETLFDELAGTGRCFACEINERPPNPGSLRFHKRLGFEEIGRADHGEKAVIFCKKAPVPSQAIQRTS